MGSCDHPSIGDQGSAAAELAGEESRLDQGHLPGMRAKASGVTAHNPIGTSVDLAAAWE